MDMNIDIVERWMRGFVFGDSAPSFEDKEFATLLVAIKSLSATETQQVGAKALKLMLDRMACSMEAEKSLRIMRDGNPTLFFN